MPIAQPNRTGGVSKPYLMSEPDPADPPKPDVIRPSTPHESPEEEIPVGVPDPLRDLPPPATPHEIPRDRPPEIPPLRAGD
jgi:hypothetical protein